MANDKKRAANWDLLRSLAMLFVVIAHATYNEAAILAWDSDLISRIVNNAVIICDPIFFTLSGYFALRASERSLREYYLNKVSTIILPLVLYSVIIYLCKNINDPSALSLNGYFLNFTNQLSSGWWFIPALVPCLIAAPFISRGMEHLSDRQVGALGIVLMVLSGWGVGMGFIEWAGAQAGLAGLSSAGSLALELIPPSALSASLCYFQFFIIGGIFRRAAPSLRGRAGTVAIIVGALFWIQDTVFAALSIPRGAPSYSWVFTVLGIMVLFDRVRIEAKAPTRIITWTAKRSYAIYLLQYGTLSISLKVFYEWSLFGNVGEMDAVLRIAMWVVSTLAAYLLALLLASIGDTILVANLQKLFNRAVQGKRAS